MKRILIPIVALTSLFGTGLLAEETKHFGPGTGWLHIDYPSNYVTDPKSHQGEAKWWARFSAPDQSLSIETMSRGYCSQSLEEEGYKNPEDYVLRHIVPGSPLRTGHEGYDRLIRVDAASVTVIYLHHDATWGKCYEELRFTFAEGGYERHRDEIMKVIHSARPSFGPNEAGEAPPK